MLIYIQEIQYKEIQTKRASKCKNVIFRDIRMQSKSPNFVYSTFLLIERRQKAENVDSTVRRGGTVFRGTKFRVYAREEHDES